LIVFTAIVGMVLASPGMVPLPVLVFGTLGIAMASGCAATLNHIVDCRIDKRMARTRRRPLPTGSLRTSQALAFAAVLGVGSMLVLWLSVGELCALLTFGSLIGYAVVYTGWLKRATPQNIVIGGAAGAAPPVLGWVAVTHSIDAQALVLFMIIFAWTPPHFWSLAIARREEYAKVGIPMLPVTHGIAYTRLQIVFYTVLLMLCTLMPVFTRMSGLIYLAAALFLDALSVPRPCSLPRDAARPSHTNLPFLHHLPHGVIRRIHRRSLLRAAAVGDWVRRSRPSSGSCPR